MKKIVLTIMVICGLFVFSIAPASAQKNKDAKDATVLKLGVFDVQKIMKDSKVIQGYRQKLVEQIESKRKGFVDKQKGAMEIEEKLKKEGGKLSLEERKSLEEKLGNEAKELKRLKEDIDVELQKADRELAQKALAEIGDVIKQIYEKEGYTIIFEKSGAGIIRFRDSVDITDKIIKAYDKK
jgi:Skp family chaperone for outer membrane proteins